MMFFRKVYDICIVHVCPFDLYFSWIKIYILVYQYSPIEYIEVWILWVYTIYRVYYYLFIINTIYSIFYVCIASARQFLTLVISKECCRKQIPNLHYKTLYTTTSISCSDCAFLLSGGSSYIDEGKGNTPDL